MSVAEQPLGVTGGDVPIPWNSSIEDVAWDGTYAELLAADALAECTLQHRVGGSLARSYETSDDSFIQYLATKMTGAYCYNPDTPYICSSSDYLYSTWLDFNACQWLHQRSAPACNRDPASLSVPMAIAPRFLEDGVSDVASPYFIHAAGPAPSPVGGSIGVSKKIAADLGLSGSQAWPAVIRAQDEVRYAYLNVCMAYKMREHLDDVQVAFASGTDLEQLQAMIRERAMTAVFQFSLIAKAFADIDPSADGVLTIENPHAFLPVLAAWRDAMPREQLLALGRDFALAVDLLVEASEEHNELLLRAADIQSRFGTYQGGWLRGARSDALEATYGPYRDATPRRTLVDMSAPELGVLLGLAREADALILTSQSNAFDLAANADALLDAVETLVRQAPVASGEAPESYEVYKRFGLQPVHARALVQALVEYIFGAPQGISQGGNLWDYGTLVVPADLPLRMTGTHSWDGTTLQLDKAFALVADAPMALQSQAWSYLPPVRLNPKAHPLDQGFNFKQEWVPLDDADTLGWPHPRRPFGAIPVLALARDSIARLDTAAQEFFDGASPALEVLGASIGPRQALMRNELQAVTRTTAAECQNWAFQDQAEAWGFGADVQPSQCLQLTPVLSGSDQVRRVDVLTGKGDPADEYASATVAQPLDPGPTPAGNAMATASLPLVPAYEMRSFTVSPSAGQVIDLRVMAADASFEAALYRGSFDHPTEYPRTPGQLPAAFQSALTFGRVFTEGGVLNQQAGDAWTFQRDDWSEPAYDAFGLRRNGGPIGDAALFGGTRGQAAYKHYLNVARESAQEATQAIDEAYQALFAQQADGVAAQSARTRGETVAELERAAVCGPAGAAGDCGVLYSFVPITVPACATANANANARCSTERARLLDVLGGVDGQAGFPLADPVYEQLDNDPPAFGAFRGGSLEGLMLEQWTAWHELQNTLDAAVSSLYTTAAQHDAASSADAAAKATLTATEMQVLAAKGDLEMLNEDLSFSLSELQAALTDIANAQTLAQAAIDECQGPNGLEATCEAAGVTDGIKYHHVHCPELAYRIFIELGYMKHCIEPRWEQVGYSTSSCQAARTLCDQRRALRDEYLADIERLIVPQLEAMVAELQTRIDELNKQGMSLPYIALDATVAAQEAHVAASKLGVDAADSAVSTQREAVEQAIVAAWGRLVESDQKIRRALQSSQLAVARVELEQGLAEDSIETRLGLRNRFRSFLMWRARALAENTRRLAVTARRSLESRFVVDLSEMTADEAFVQAPASWADEIYEPDLKPLSAVGGVAGPSDTLPGTVYANKLLDYVKNLERFVSGYTIQRPLTSAYSDAEVVHLSGPATVRRRTAADGTLHETLDPHQAGWSFYCPELGTWISHPAAGAFGSAGTLDWSLDTICGTGRPTLARLNFWLDPWGRKDGDANDRPPYERYNARWGRMAVNLIGADIRDCDVAADPDGCVAQPFVRYDLRHVGPTWVTDHDLQWRQLDLPAGVVEGGKALATEQWLDPVVNSFNEMTAANAARQELAGRPLGGAYQLVLHLGPEVRAEQIDRVQLLLETDYWVRDADGGTLPQTRCLQAGCGPTDGCCPQGCNSGTDLDCYCRPSSCAEQNLNCGTVSDGCGGTLDCGGCSVPETCGGGGTANVCGCTPTAEVCGDGVDNDCNGTIDENCCGNDVLEPAAGELCDSAIAPGQPGACPQSCDDGKVCTADIMAGSPATCDAQCVNSPITACNPGDGCCPVGCTYTVGDTDCPCVPTTCAVAGAQCGTLNDGCGGSLNCGTCASPLGCGVAGNPNQCECAGTIEICGDNIDNDCDGNIDNCCGNGALDAGELCDPGIASGQPGACPSSCNDGDQCTTDTLAGSAAQCTAQCVYDPVAVCCGNGTVEGAEYCDNAIPAGQPGACPTSCNDSDQCTTDALLGSAAQCTAHCSYSPITPCCGNGVVEPNEYCDKGIASGPGSCPTTCNDGQQCTTDTLVGDPNQCTAYCWYADITPCCGNGVVESGETCDNGIASGPGSCPTSCTDYACTTETYGGSPSTCNVQCNVNVIWNSCAADGCCLRDCPSDPDCHVDITVGQSHVCAYNTYGSTTDNVYCWGNNSSGQLGIGSTQHRGNDPGEIWSTGLQSFSQTTAYPDALVQVVASGNYTCALANTSRMAPPWPLPVTTTRIYCWGYGGAGNLGNGSTAYNFGDYYYPIFAWPRTGRLGEGPVDIGTYLFSDYWIGRSGLTLILGYDHACTTTLPGNSLACWGSNNLGQLGYGHTQSLGDDPNDFPLSDNFMESPYSGSAGAFFTCVLDAFNAVRCFGVNNYGQLGLGHTATLGDQPGEEAPYLPTLTMAGTPIQLVSGLYHTCALNSAGQIHCWGLGADGQMGQGAPLPGGTTNWGDEPGETPAALPPVNIGGPAVALAAGLSHTCAIRNDGAVFCWGSNYLGQLGYGHTNTIGDDERPVDAGPVSVGDAAARIAAGGHTTCVTFAGNTRRGRCWGDNSLGQLGLGSTVVVGDNEVPTASSVPNIGYGPGVLDFSILGP